MTREPVPPTRRFEIGDVAELGTGGLTRLVAGMQAVLEGLEARTLPDDRDYTCDDLGAYLRSLVKGQRGELSLGERCGHVVAGSWGVNVDCDGMPGDCRVDFVFFPTYLAVATLSRCVLQFPLLAASVDGLVPALQSGLGFACGRRLEGHGYEADEEKQRALNLLHMGWVPLLLWQNPDFCPEMNALLEKTPHHDFHVEYEMKQLFGLYQGVFRRELAERELAARPKVAYPEILTRKWELEKERELEEFAKQMEEVDLESLEREHEAFLEEMKHWDEDPVIRRVLAKIRDNPENRTLVQSMAESMSPLDPKPDSSNSKIPVPEPPPVPSRPGRPIYTRQPEPPDGPEGE